METTNKNITTIDDELLLFILSICNVTTQDFMMKSNQYYSQVKWLYWYACRYIKNETYSIISQRPLTIRKQYTIDGIRKGVEKMSDIINNDIIWRKRWNEVLNFCNIKPLEQDAKLTLTIELPHNIKKKDVQIYIKDNVK